VTGSYRLTESNAVRGGAGLGALFRLTAVALLGACLLDSPLDAKLCGDDVDGKDVACDCGDTVVSSVVLQNDPVTARQCPSDGLIVRGMEEGVLTVNLNGQTLRGSGKGAGVWIMGGGGGSLVGGPGASVIGFRDGVLASGAQSVSSIRQVIVRNSTRDGVRVSGTGYRVENVESYSSGRDGFSLAGRHFTVLGTQAVSSGRFGYMITGQNGLIGGAREAQNRATLSGSTGFNILGSGHQLVECESLHNARDGVALSGAKHEVISCQAERNLGNGITGTGSAWLLRTNSTRANRNHGLLVRGVSLIDGGGNRGTENLGELSQRAAVQCEIGGEPCE